MLILSLVMLAVNTLFFGKIAFENKDESVWEFLIVGNVFIMIMIFVMILPE